MNSKKMTLSGWGLFPKTTSFVCRPEKLKDLQECPAPFISRGLGRSYGDAAQITDGHVILMERLNRFLAFDHEMGVLRAEAGVTFEDILQVIVPRGWFPPVTPGTKHVTLGGSVAADVHGKNHHVDGSIGKYILEIELQLVNGRRQRCSPEIEPDLFWATIGGMGLTGIITEVKMQLIPIQTAFISVKNTPVKNLDEMFDRLARTENDDRYSVAWIDCIAGGEEFGRGIIMNGHHAAPGELKNRQASHPFRFKKQRSWNVPKILPSLLLNKHTVETFNKLYFHINAKKPSSHIVDYETYFYPLDIVEHWNKMYGRKGFIQYQFVIPFEHSREVCRQVLTILSGAGLYPYLAVLKRFGPEGKGLLSFPMEGYTLALDIPYSNELLSVLDKIDGIIAMHQGRIYLAKDARMAANLLPAMYPRLDAWKQIKNRFDFNGKISSDLSRRLHL